MEKIELKKWNEYSPAEKSELLHHWWYYYGKMIITLDENEKFSKIVEKNSDQVFLLAAIAYVFNMSSQQLVGAIRDNRVDELFSVLPIIEEENDEFKNDYAQLESEFISMLIGSYYNPEPSIPMEIGDIVSQVVKTKL